MIETGGLTQYSLGCTLSMVLLTLGLFLPSSVRAQDCGPAKQRIYQITETDAQHNPDSLQTLLNLAVFVRDCEVDVSQELELWLLTNETFALVGLERYEDASELVDRFFSDHFEEAADLHRARFYMWRLHLGALRGNGVSMVADYLEAREYASVLDANRRARLYKNGAYAYMGIREYERSLRLVREARATLSRIESYEDSLILGHIIQIRAEAQLHVGTQLDQVKEDFTQAVRLFEALGDTARASTSTTMLGEAYAAEGDTSFALVQMATSVRLAQESGSVRSEVYALFRQGQLLRQSGDYEAAEQSLSQALAASETFREFHLRTLYELARLHEQRREYEQAKGLYQTVIDAPEPVSIAAELEATRKALEGRMRVLLFEREQDQRRLSFVISGSLLGFLLLIGLAGAGYFWHVRRREAIIGQLQSATVIPKNLNTGLTLEQLEQRFQKLAGLDLFGSRLAFIFAVLFEPDLVLPYIEDDYLLPQVEADRVADNSALFLCVAAVEEHVRDVKFQGRAENTLRSYLSGEFDKRGWDWPKNPLAWKLFFLEQHAKVLF